jgi:hypothetical protein
MSLEFSVRGFAGNTLLHVRWHFAKFHEGLLIVCPARTPHQLFGLGAEQLGNSHQSVDSGGGLSGKNCGSLAKFQVGILAAFAPCVLISPVSAVPPFRVQLLI